VQQYSVLSGKWFHRQQLTVCLLFMNRVCPHRLAKVSCETERWPLFIVDGGVGRIMQLEGEISLTPNFYDPSKLQANITTDVICALLEYYPAYSGNVLPTFRENLTVIYSRFKKSLFDVCGSVHLGNM
jgi:hypothetical protein